MNLSRDLELLYCLHGSLAALRNWGLNFRSNPKSELIRHRSVCLDPRSSGCRGDHPWLCPGFGRGGHLRRTLWLLGGGTEI